MELKKSIGKNPKTGLELVAVFESVTIGKDSQVSVGYRQVEMDLQGEPYNAMNAPFKTVSAQQQPSMPMGGPVAPAAEPTADDKAKADKNLEKLEKMRMDIMAVVQKYFNTLDFKL